MRVVGVRLPDGEAVWADAGDLRLAPLDRVVIRLTDGDHTGVAFMAPDQLVGDPPMVAATALAVAPQTERKRDDGDLPGADLPPLGSAVSLGEAVGTVMALDPVQRTVTVTRDDGGSVTVPFPGHRSH